jgi:hypothetical protein
MVVRSCGIRCSKEHGPVGGSRGISGIRVFFRTFPSRRRKARDAEASMHGICGSPSGPGQGWNVPWDPRREPISNPLDISQQTI